MPEQKQNLTNEQLQKAIADFKQESSQQRLGAIFAALVRAQLLVPARIAPGPGGKPPLRQPDGRVALPKDTRLGFAKLNTPQGEQYFVAFTDEAAFKAMQKDKNAPPQQFAVLLRFDGLINLLAKDKQAAGLILDPFTNGLRIPRQALEALVAQLSGAIRPGEDVTIVEPSVLPDALLDPICQILNDTAQIEAAYLQLAIRKNGPKSYLLILNGSADKALMERLTAAAKPYLQQNPQRLGLTIVPAASPLGQQGMQGSEPFYRRGVGRIRGEDSEE